MRRILGGLLFLSLLVCAPAWATNFFYWDMDSQVINHIYNRGNNLNECDTNQNGGNGFFQGVAIIDTSTKAKGTGSVRVSIPSSQDAGHRICRPTEGDNLTFTYPWNFQSGNHIYYRMWMKVDPTFPTGGTFTHAKAGRTYNNGTKIFTSEVGKGAIGWDNCQFCTTTGQSNRHGVDLVPPCMNSGLPGGPYDCTQWHEYIFHLKLPTGSSANGYTQLYIDGNLISTNSGIGFSASGTVTEGWGWIAGLYPQLTIGNNKFWWFDDVSIDDSWNSSIGPQPNPPTLLPVQ